MKLARVLALLFSTLLAAAGSANAGEIKVVDSIGLTRAVKQVRGAARVIVTLRGADGGRAQISLTNTSGISSDVSGVAEQGGRYSFPGITDGTWKINLSGPGVVVTEVKILP